MRCARVHLHAAAAAYVQSQGRARTGRADLDDAARCLLTIGVNLRSRTNSLPRDENSDGASTILTSGRKAVSDRRG